MEIRGGTVENQHGEYMKPICEETKSEIENKFGIPKRTIVDFEDKYEELKNGISYQYLAHIIRTLETYIRENKNMRLFRITCRAKEVNEKTSGLAWASYPKNGFSYNIYYDKNADGLQKRVAIAHELGHLFYVIKFDKDMSDTHEPLSSLFGIIALIDRQETLKNIEKHHSEKDIVDDFSLLMNRENGKLNVSN